MAASTSNPRNSPNNNNTENPWNIHHRNVPQRNQDASSVYYIHPSNSNSSQLASVKFNGIGFTNWKRAVTLSLSAKNKLGFVNGSLAKPAVDSPDLKAWERCNDLVCSWLLASLDDNIAKSVLFFNTAKEIWSDLEERFGFVSMAQVFSLEQQLTDLAQGSKSVSEFFTEIKALWDAMNDANPLPLCICQKCTCNVNQKIHQREQDHRLIQFMMKLGERFSAVRGNILMQMPLPNLSAAFRMFSQEERHQEISVSNTESMAFLADNKRNFNNKPTCGNFLKQPGVLKKPSKYYRTHCKMSGHSLERCFKINGYPPGFKAGKGKRVAAIVSSGPQEEVNANSPITMAQYSQLMALLGPQPTPVTKENTETALLAGKFCFLTENATKFNWLIDSGATDHICSDIKMFSSHSPVVPTEFITIPDGKKVDIQHTGTVTLSNNLKLKNVLHVPEFHFNLLSVHKLCKDLNCEVIFSGAKCILQDLSQKESQMLLGEEEAGLYKLDKDQSSSSQKQCCDASTSTDAALWHIRLGHIPFSKLKLALP